MDLTILHVALFAAIGGIWFLCGFFCGYQLPRTFNVCFDDDTDTDDGSAG